MWTARKTSKHCNINKGDKPSLNRWSFFFRKVCEFEKSLQKRTRRTELCIGNGNLIWITRFFFVSQGLYKTVLCTQNSVVLPKLDIPWKIKLQVVATVTNAYIFLSQIIIIFLIGFNLIYCKSADLLLTLYRIVIVAVAIAFILTFFKIIYCGFSAI